MATRRAPTGLAGAAGEYHVAAQLSQRGWLATITIKNSPGTDVLAQHAVSGAVVAIQTKTATSGTSSMLSVKDEMPTARENAWYVIVSLNGLDQRPDFYVMPRNHVSAFIYVAHRQWLSKPGRRGQKRRDTSMRSIYHGEIQAYREQWDWLLNPTADVPYAMPDWFYRHVGRIGLPPGHPDAAQFAGAPSVVSNSEPPAAHADLL